LPSVFFPPFERNRIFGHFEPFDSVEGRMYGDNAYAGARKAAYILQLALGCWVLGVVVQGAYKLSEDFVTP